MSFYTPLIFSLLLLVITSVADPVVSSKKKENTNKLLPILLSLPFPSKTLDRLRGAYKHSNLENSRFGSDCRPNCPKVDVWQYTYKPVGEKKLIIDDKPISTQKNYWKTEKEARIIAVTLFGNKEIYLNGLIDFIDSIERLKKVNKIATDDFGYGSFTIRAYVGKRKPENNLLGQLKGITDDRFIKRLIDKGVEIAYVDNHLEQVGLDATFWRFMIAAENMPENQRIRYFIRDVDWFLTALDVFVLADWILKKHDFHRMNIYPLCISPLVAGVWGGTHQGKSPFTDLQNQIEYYPYRLQYGDDELFLRDFIWEKIKSSGSVLTHIIKKRTLFNKIIEPFKNSCEEPTSDFCAFYSRDHRCVDKFIPKAIKFSALELSKRTPLREIADDYFYLDESDPQIKKVIQILKEP